MSVQILCSFSDPVLPAARSVARILRGQNVLYWIREVADVSILGDTPAQLAEVLDNLV